MVPLCNQVSAPTPERGRRGHLADQRDRWREAFDARKNHPEGDKIVPKIFLNATNEKALGKISMDELKAFAADK